MTQVSEKWKCSACGGEIPTPEPRRPCTACGSDARTTDIRIHSTLTITSSTESAVEYTFPRPWDEAWYDLGRLLELLRRCYANSQPFGTDMKKTIDDFFDTCHRLLDALGHSTETMVHSADATDYATKHSPALQLAFDYDNTRKHYDRDKPKAVRARVSKIMGRADRSSATIEYWSALDSRKNTVDALDLAGQCHAAWLQFLDNRKLL